MTDNTLREAILRVRFPYIDQQEVNRPVTVHWFDVLRAIETAIATPTTQPTDNTGLIERAREAAARYYENDPLDKARKQIAALIREGRAMDDQDATQIALYALADSDRHYAAALATKDAEIAYLENWKGDAADQIVTLTRANVEKDAEIAALKEAVSRFVNDFDDGDRADVGTSALLLAHISDFVAALGAKP